MITTLPDVIEIEQASFAELAHRNLAAVSRELIEHACTILRQDADSLTFRAAPVSLTQKIFPWTRKVYRIHCAGANVHLSPRGQYHDLAHGSREAVMREFHSLMRR